MPDRSKGRGSHERFTISYAGFNRPWATWIAHQLDQLGHETTLPRWDPPLSTSLADAVRSLLQAPGWVLLVHDNWYFSLGPRSEAEWTDALQEVVPPFVDRVSAVSVATRALPPIAAWLRPVDLRDNVPHRNLRFIGRDEILEELHDRFERGGWNGARVALRGISGVGKTQIAIEYAHRFGNDYDIVWWVRALQCSGPWALRPLAPSLGLDVGQELSERIRAVHEALRTGSPHKRWLIVLDNTDDMEQIEDLLPEGNGHVLDTTPAQDWHASGAVTEIEVLPFQRVESVACVRRHAERLTADEADLLAEAVQDLPLLLVQTGAWLDANSILAKDYINMIRRGEASRIGICIPTDYPMGFQANWSITLNTLQDKNPEAVELLYLFALFSPDAIPVRLLQAPAHPSGPRQSGRGHRSGRPLRGIARPAPRAPADPRAAAGRTAPSHTAFRHVLRLNAESARPLCRGRFPAGAEYPAHTERNARNGGPRSPLDARRGSQRGTGAQPDGGRGRGWPTQPGHAEVRTPRAERDPPADALPQGRPDRRPALPTVQREGRQAGGGGTPTARRHPRRTSSAYALRVETEASLLGLRAVAYESRARKGRRPDCRAELLPSGLRESHPGKRGRCTMTPTAVDSKCPKPWG
ncbi:FxSxx-COOH system tetratricopeptide repeat protein [Streptomyces sp. YIM S03343]